MPFTKRIKPDDDTEAVEAEGHRYVPGDERPTVGETKAPVVKGEPSDDDDGTEGHRVSRHNIGVPLDVDTDDTDDPKEHDMPIKRGSVQPGDDTEAVEAEGHRYVPGDERPTVGETKAPVVKGEPSDDDDGTEGHRASLHNIGVRFDDA